MRFFNTGGVCVPGRHYMLPPEPRLPGALTYADRWEYFVVHAPRQTGKTTTLRSLARHLAAGGRFAAASVSCERAAEVGADLRRASVELLDAIRSAAEQQLPVALRPPDSWPDSPPGSLVFNGLQEWAVGCPLPVALLLDEVDALEGQVLRSVLHQLRDGHQYRAHAFPATIVLCGMRDVRDYKVAAGGNPGRLGGPSPFNVAVDSIRIGDFTVDEIAELYAQHTADTGQEFTPEAVERAFAYSQGQPWLVNAIAREIVDLEKMAVPCPVPVTAGLVDTAKERLILARAIHLDSLADKLTEPRVKRVIEPLVAGTLPELDPTFNDDVSYVRDLGLISRDIPIRVANPIYREVIVRALGADLEQVIYVDKRRFILPDGQLDFPAILQEFARFWPEHEGWLGGFDYREAAMQIMFMMFLQRIVNGGGFVDREYGVGSGKIDVLVRKPYGDHLLQREAIELKVWHPGKGDPLKQGLSQLDGYLADLGLDAGTLVIFDRRPNAAPVADRTRITKEQAPSGREITLLRA